MKHSITNLPSTTTATTTIKNSLSLTQTYLRQHRRLHGERQHPKQTPVSNRYTNENSSDTPMIVNCRYHVYRIIVDDISLKTRCFGQISVTECLRLSLTIFTQCAPEAAEFGEMKQNMGHFAVQGHSRSPTSVPIESS